MDNLEISKEGYLNLLKKGLSYKIEERDLALDRYRRQDDQMQTPEDFVLQGRNAVSFLNAASSSSDQILKIASEIKGIIFKEESPTQVEVNISDDWKKNVEDLIKNSEKKD